MGMICRDPATVSAAGGGTYGDRVVVGGGGSGCSSCDRAESGDCDGGSGDGRGCGGGDGDGNGGICEAESFSAVDRLAAGQGGVEIYWITSSERRCQDAMHCRYSTKQDALSPTAPAAPSAVCPCSRGARKIFTEYPSPLLSSSASQVQTRSITAGSAPSMATRAPRVSEAGLVGPGGRSRGLILASSLILLTHGIVITIASTLLASGVWRGGSVSEWSSSG